MIGDAHSPGLIPRFLTTLLNLAEETHMNTPAAADTSHDSKNSSNNSSSYSIEVRHMTVRDTWHCNTYVTAYVSPEVNNI